MHPAKSVIFYHYLRRRLWPYCVIIPALCFGMASFDTAFYISALIAVLSSAGLISLPFIWAIRSVHGARLASIKVPGCRVRGYYLS